MIVKKENFKVYNLEGSLLGWVHLIGDLKDKKGQKTKKVHVYEKDWDFLPKGFIPVH